MLDDLKNILDLFFPDALSINDGMDRFDGEYFITVEVNDEDMALEL